MNFRGFSVNQAECFNQISINNKILLSGIIYHRTKLGLDWTGLVTSTPGSGQDQLRTESELELELTAGTRSLAAAWPGLAGRG